MKPHVKFKECLTQVRIGWPVVCIPIDHPSELVSNTKSVITSPVVKINHDGFETLNTVYHYAKE